MGLMLACCAADALCCATSGVVKCCCCAIPCQTSTTTRLTYTFGFVVTTVLAWAMSRWGAGIPGIPLTEECGVACWNYLAVDRIGLAFALYHVFFFLLTLGVKNTQDPRAWFHNGAWPVKFLLWLGAIIGCFYIPAEYFSTYYIATYFFSALFIILQSMLLVGFAWSASASLLSKWEETGGSVYKFLLVGITAGSYLTVITFTVLLFVFFASNAGCDLNRFFIAFNLVWVLLLTGASILPKVQEANPRSGIFQAAIMSLYTTYLIGSAIATQPLDQFQCRTIGGSSSSAEVQEDTLSLTMLYVGIIFTFVSIGYSSFSAGSSSDLVGGSSSDGAAPLDKDDEAEETKYNYAWFHFVFFLAGMYITAVLTNWAMPVLHESRSSSSSSETVVQVDYGVASMWIKVVTSWVSVLLYVWTLVAPLVLTERSFG